MSLQEVFQTGVVINSRIIKQALGLVRENPAGTRDVGVETRTSEQLAVIPPYAETKQQIIECIQSTGVKDIKFMDRHRSNGSVEYVVINLLHRGSCVERFVLVTKLLHPNRDQSYEMPPQQIAENPTQFTPELAERVKGSLEKARAKAELSDGLPPDYNRDVQAILNQVKDKFTLVCEELELPMPKIEVGRNFSTSERQTNDRGNYRPAEITVNGKTFLLKDVVSSRSKRLLPPATIYLGGYEPSETHLAKTIDRDIAVYIHATTGDIEKSLRAEKFLEELYSV